MKRYIVISSALILLSCNSGQNKANGTAEIALPVIKEFKLASPAFKEGDTIPRVYTCEGSNTSPALYWNKPSDKVKSYALIMDDPDSPMGIWVHWVMYNIPAADNALPQNIPADSNLGHGVRQGITSFRTCGYGGPCPPNGSHRYFFKLYALDATIELSCRSTGEKALTEAMKGHIIAEAGLMGTYHKVAD